MAHRNHPASATGAPPGDRYFDACRTNVPIGFLIFVTHFFAGVAIQFQKAALTQDISILDWAPYQVENFLVSAAISLIYIISKNRLSKLISYAIFTLSLLSIFLGGVYYQIFRDNLTISFLDEVEVWNFYDYWGSFWAELGPVQYLNFAFLLGLAGLFAYLEFRRPARPQIRQLSPRRAAVWSAAPIAALLLVQQVVPPLAQGKKVVAHPLIAIWQGGLGNAVAPELARDLPPERFFSLLHGTAADDGANTARLQRNLEILRAKPRNLILVVLESVGSKQLLKNGKPRTDLAPFLASRSKEAVIFDNVTVTFPASTRSHIALSTGGTTLTWGSVNNELLHRYTGDTLVSRYRNAGRETGLFSAAGLNYENLNAFYFNLGFDHILEPETQPEAFRTKYRTHSWGVDEAVIVDRMLEWFSERSEPALAFFLSIITHHPYGAPEGFEKPFPSDTSINKYQNALRYTDHILERLASKLKKSGLSQNTMIAIVGDHGEAFGRFHANNFVHKNYLYEENIRDFFMLIDLSEEIEPVYSRKRAFVGDIMPTLLDIQGIEIPRSVIGQSLFSPKYEEKMAFFHKSAHPEQWGLRDGAWKFIVERNGKHNPELYNLDDDPDEKTNLADRYPERAGEYIERIANWYVYSNNLFVSNLEDYVYPGGDRLLAGESLSPGPKHISVGLWYKGTPFVPLEGAINPEEALTVWTYGPAFETDTEVNYVLTSPSGKSYSHWFTHKNSWSTVYYTPGFDEPREEGVWNVQLLADGKELINKRFTVSGNAKLHWSQLDQTPSVRHLAFGTMREDGNFRELKHINPHEQISVFAEGIPFHEDKRVYLSWISPSGKVRPSHFVIKKDWHTFWVSNPSKLPLEEGTWQLVISFKDQTFVSGEFEVTSSAPLFGVREVDLASSK